MSRLVLAVPIYLLVAIGSFIPFGDDGTTVHAVVVAASLNAAFGLVFGWRFLWLPPLVFGLWYSMVGGGCEDCTGIFRDVTLTACVSAAAGAAVRRLVALTRPQRAPRAVDRAPGPGRAQAP